MGFLYYPSASGVYRFVGLTEVTDKSLAAHGHDEACAQEGSSDNQICIGRRRSILNTGSSASTSSGFTIAGGSHRGHRKWRIKHWYNKVKPPGLKKPL